MLINLILTVCLSNSPGQCREETLTFESQGNLAKCMFLAPIEIAKWSDSHPTLNVTRWKCKFPGTDDEI